MTPPPEAPWTPDFAPANQRPGQPQVINIPLESEHHRLDRDVVYGEAGGQELKYHFYRPQKAEGPTPAFLFIHGGGFVQGDPTQGAGYGLSYARRGIATFATTYRLAPKHRFPGSLHDTRRALRYLKANAEHFNIDPDKIVMLGLSAGAYLVVMAHLAREIPELALTDFPEELADVNEEALGIIAHYGPYDFRNPGRGPAAMLTRIYLPKDKADDAEFLEMASPIVHAHHATAPIQFIHGAEDRLVPVKESKAMGGALREAGKEVEVHVIEGADHAFQMDWSGEYNRESDQHMKAFLSKLWEREL